ncbi:MAG: hypothetical protein D6732_17385 [Methanobacteriota archaeon]|nr:MAG: hypothetical protein D6732_17385 [Euryarchaeota archaeon]
MDVILMDKRLILVVYLFIVTFFTGYRLWVLTISGVIFSQVVLGIEMGKLWQVHFLRVKDQLRICRFLIQTNLLIFATIVLIFLKIRIMKYEPAIPLWLVLIWIPFQVLTMAGGYMASYMVSQKQKRRKGQLLRVYELSKKINSPSQYIISSTKQFFHYEDDKIEFIPADFFEEIGSSFQVVSKNLKYGSFRGFQINNDFRGVGLISNTLIPSFFSKATEFSRISWIEIPQSDELTNFLSIKGFDGDVDLGKSNLNKGIWIKEISILVINICKVLEEEEGTLRYSPPNMVLLEALEEYYELHREEIEQQVAALKEELRQTIRRYEGKRLWLRGKSRMWLDSKRHFLAELDKEYPEL